MKDFRRISSALVMIFMLLATCVPAEAKSDTRLENITAIFSQISFVANIETIGIAVSGSGLPASAQLLYRRSGETGWTTGHPVMRIDDGRLIGSLFNLSPATSYEIKVLDGVSEITGSAATQPDQLSFSPSVVLHVNDDAPAGGNGSAAAPFRTIQEAVNHAGPGTQVLVADGLYREAITFPASGTAGNWIQVKAAGNAAILDSADRLTGNIWTAYSTSKVWFTRITGPVAYVARDGNRFYQYDDRTGLLQAKGHGGVAINEGWYYEPSTSRLYVRSQDNPSGHTWRIPRLNHAFDIASRAWIWIEGFEIRYYGTTTNGCGVCTLNVSHLVVRRNRIHNMQLGIFVNWNGTFGQGNDTRIEQNEIYDPGLYGLPWAALKGSFMEGTGIIVRGHIGAIVRDNTLHGYFNGIYTGSSGALENSELAFDADIYGNSMYHISDDGLEPEGACINHRFRNNTVDRSFIGVSIAPVTQGPTWVLHSVFSNFTGRGIKFADSSDGIVLIYHNTSWTTVGNITGVDLITSIHNVKMRNNVFQSTGYSIYEVPIGSTRNDWNYDNWYTTRGSAGPHFKWENVNYNTIFSLCTASGLECNGYETPPGFTNPAGGDFTLLSNSPNIDRGIVLPGINDNFAGNGPDAGAYESGFDLHPTILSRIGADLEENYHLTQSQSQRVSYFGVNNGPVEVESLNELRIIASQRVIWGVSYSEMMGLPAEQLTDEYLFPYYNNVAMDSQLRVSNLGGVPTTITVTLAGQQIDSYTLGAGGATRKNYPGKNSGPLRVTSSATDILTTIRVLYGGKSYSELMGYPANMLTQEYWYPVYDNAAVDSQLRVSNVGGGSTTITVYLGTQQIDSYTLGAGGATRKNYPGQNSGPLRVVSSSQPILTTIRMLYAGSLSELMGFPANQLAQTYWYPVYDNAALDSQLRVSNVGGGPTTITVYLGTQQIDSYSLGAGGATRKNYPGQNSGPLRVVSSSQPILTTIRMLHVTSTFASLYEMTGLPDSQLSTQYFFPWYNNTAMTSELRFAVP